MSSKQSLLVELEDLPASIIEEILHYVLFLKKVKTSAASDITLASESVLAKDWLLPEEDAAWASL